MIDKTQTLHGMGSDEEEEGAAPRRSGRARKTRMDLRPVLSDSALEDAQDDDLVSDMDEEDEEDEEDDDEEEFVLGRKRRKETADEGEPRRKRGRPKGSKNKAKPEPPRPRTEAEMETLQKSVPPGLRASSAEEEENRMKKQAQERERAQREKAQRESSSASKRRTSPVPKGPKAGPLANLQAMLRGEPVETDSRRRASPVPGKSGAALASGERSKKRPAPGLHKHQPDADRKAHVAAKLLKSRLLQPTETPSKTRRPKPARSFTAPGLNVDAGSTSGARSRAGSSSSSPAIIAAAAAAASESSGLSQGRRSPMDGGSSTPGEAKKQKRPKLRRLANAFPNSPDLGCPANTKTSWNASEILKGFLYIGAGWDQNGRCLVNRKHDAKELKAERAQWCRAHNMCYALNMAGHPLQVELKGIQYVLPETKVKRLEMNDVDSWDASMLERFEEGAAFIEEAWKKHLDVRAICSLNGSKPPTIFVHCVAGVNRSPMCVVWWLSRYHGVHIRDAWDLVRLRRDSGAFWTDVTLGGPAPPEGLKLDPDVYRREQRGGVRAFQHRYDKLNPDGALVKAEQGKAEPRKAEPDRPGAAPATPGKEATPAPEAADSNSGNGTADAEAVADVMAAASEFHLARSKSFDSVEMADSDAAADDPTEKEEGGSEAPPPKMPTTSAAAAAAAAAAACCEESKGKRKSDRELYPKGLWFQQAEEILRPYFKRRLGPSGNSLPWPAPLETGARQLSPVLSSTSASPPSAGAMVSSALPARMQTSVRN